MVDIGFGIAFLAGVLSFLSPCILPLVPAFISYISGVSVNEAKSVRPRLAIFSNSVFFVLGFTLVFSAFGVLLNTVLGSAAYDVRIWAARAGGVVIIIFGLYLLGLVKINWLQAKHGLRARKFRSSYLTSFVFGASFAVGWTPCVGAILGGILTLAAVLPVDAFALLVAYSLGLGIPFLVAGFFAGRLSGFIKRSEKWIKYTSYIAGVLLVIIGILVFTNTLQILSNFFFFSIPGFEGL